jgi:hypothetical protein
MHYMQRSRANWLINGDRNTTFFQNFAKARGKRNAITKLKDENGNWKEGNEEIGAHIKEYFSSLFQTSIPGTDDTLLNRVRPCVSREMNESLLKPYTAEEVKAAMFSIGDYKAPGTDGLHAIFFKKFWSVVGDQVTTEVLQALNTGVIPEGWNETAIVLIPKVESPELVTQFRPISLCNVMYKVIAKVLAKRLKMILPEIISPTQSAFVSGRLISDNVLVAYECFHTIKKRRQRNNGIFAIKLDMNKAYDRVEWGFFKDMMLRLGFSESWVSMIMACVTSVNYRIWFNSDETDCFSPSRGIRQGDHLSPYLFLLCSEGLSSLLEFEEVTGGIQGVRVCRSAPAISHLLFADDSLILMNDDVSNATALRKVLDLYCASSGQLVSEANSSVFSVQTLEWKFER